MTASIRMWVADPIPRDVAEALDRLAEVPDVQRIAVMPDVHLAEDVCVGVALASSRRIFPAAVGGDIGCGMAAVRFDVNASRIDERTAARILTGLYRSVPAIRHRHPPPMPDLPPLSSRVLERLAARDGRVEFGTLGRGNHFLELQSDEEGSLWLMIHSGSRAIGPAIRDHHVRDASHQGGLQSFDADTDQGRAYLSDMSWALSYADASRAAMEDAVERVLAEVLGAERDRSSRLSCFHNHVRREEHGGELLWVHRKGAISASSREMGIIPGSMGTASYHVEGRGLAEALRTSSHGAGRAMSRGEARRKISSRALLRQMHHVWFDQRQAASLRDEAPSAYKDINAVMRAQRELTKVIRRLSPLLAYKGA